ncbi:MAG: hypothetical protein AB1403_24995, partial [Candidatus Riflebacteria bacterium]
HRIARLLLIAWNKENAGSIISYCVYTYSRYAVANVNDISPLQANWHNQQNSSKESIPSPKSVSIRKTPIYGGRSLPKTPYMAVKKHNFKIGEGIEEFDI